LSVHPKISSPPLAAFSKISLKENGEGRLVTEKDLPPHDLKFPQDIPIHLSPAPAKATRPVAKVAAPAPKILQPRQRNLSRTAKSSHRKRKLKFI
jgi:hypothetical protein